MTQPRTEYPRPQLVREHWLNLNGEWNFVFDDENIGKKEQWQKSFPVNPLTITVPFAYQTELSGINDPSFHDVVWYQRTVSIPEEWKNERQILHFGAVDYRADVFVNGDLAVQHEGGNVPFSADITDLLGESSEAVIAVRVEDPSTDVTIPRGKQYWHEESASIFYTRTTGIWQTVWLEPVSDKRFEKLRFTPDIDNGDIAVEFDVTNMDLTNTAAEADVLITFKGQTVIEDTIKLHDDYNKRIYNLRNRFTDRSNIHGAGWYWTPAHPNLFDVELTLKVDGNKEDHLSSYFGMRKVSIEQGHFMLNNHRYYQKLVLDQGYFREGLLTAPSDEALKKDIELAKQMGFNGARKHQKIEDPRYLYWADKLGFLVWGEMANASEFSEDAVVRMTREWIQAVNRDYNHPSLVVWLPLNESWGISRVAREAQQQFHSLEMYYLTKALDTTRPVLSNDGWEHTVSDICGIHNYRDRDTLLENYATRENAIAAEPAYRKIYADGFSHRGEPILITEYGGIAYEIESDKGWGYSSVNSGDELIEGYRKLTEALFASPVIEGFCYTQLTDVEQEINGLLSYDRKPKCDLSEIKKINDQKH